MSDIRETYKEMFKFDPRRAITKAVDEIEALRDKVERLEREKDEAKQLLGDCVSALDCYLGDSDVDYFETEDEMKEEEPVQWVCMQLSLVVQPAQPKDDSDE